MSINFSFSFLHLGLPVFFFNVTNVIFITDCYVLLNASPFQKQPVSFLEANRALTACKAEVREELHMNRRRNAQRSSSGQQGSGFLLVATTPQLLRLAASPEDSSWG